MPPRGGVGLPGDMPQIQIPVFQGPLDLLLHLIERDDLDITAVSLVAVTDQYLRAVRAQEGTQPALLAEFISIGAKLIYLKSKALLPRPKDDTEDSIDDDEVGQQLIEMLREYRRFGEIADLLGRRQEAGLRSYPRMAPAPVFAEGPGLHSVTVDSLRAIMLQALNATPKPERPRAVIVRDPVMSLSQCVAGLRSLVRAEGKISFRWLMEECASRAEVIVTFMAVLELLKAGDIDAVQGANYDDFEVVAIKVRP